MEKEQQKVQLFDEFYAIFRESFLLTLSRRKIFSQITIYTIFPLSLLFLCHVLISESLFGDIVQNEGIYRYTQVGSPKNSNIWDTLLSRQILYWLFKTSYFIFFLILSLLSMSAVVCTVACHLQTKEITFEEVMSMAPKAWKRLVVTFAWTSIVVLAYNVVAFSMAFPRLGVAISGLGFIMYVMGVVWISVVWHVASVVSVLEQDCGVEAMMKSMALVKGKMVISFGIFFLLNLCFILLQLGYQRFVVLGESVWIRVGCGILCFFLLSGLTLLALVIQTVVYFVCKSYHYENMDKSVLDNYQFELHTGDYSPLRSEEV